MVEFSARLAYRGEIIYLRPRGRLAQLAEQLTLNQRVLGSSPSAPTNLFKDLERTL